MAVLALALALRTAAAARSAGSDCTCVEGAAGEQSAAAPFCLHYLILPARLDPCGCGFASIVFGPRGQSRRLRTALQPPEHTVLGVHGTDPRAVGVVAEQVRRQVQGLAIGVRHSDVEMGC